MRSDALFYELFKLDPQSLIRLVRLKLKARYTFQSITVKQTERRFDGYFEPIDAEAPLLFVEVQGYNDPKVYWRLLREIAMVYEQRKDEVPFVAVLLVLDESFIPKVCQFRVEPPSELITRDLATCLNALNQGAGAATVLKPLVLESREELSVVVPHWMAELNALPVTEPERRQLTDLLCYAIVQRFPTLTAREIQQMLRLTPWEDTVVGREVFEMGLEKGIEQGIEKGIEQGIEKGVERGLAQGIEKGRQQLLAKLLRLKFGPLSDEVVSRLEGIHDPARLDALAEQVLTANALDELSL